VLLRFEFVDLESAPAVSALDAGASAAKNLPMLGRIQAMHRRPRIRAVADIGRHFLLVRDSGQRGDEPVVAAGAVHGRCEAHDDGSNSAFGQADRVPRVSDSRMHRWIGHVSPGDVEAIARGAD
jgi:hypothetical protein